MPSLTLAPPPHFTVEENYRIAETGILAPDARVELLEGQIIDPPPVNSVLASSVRFDREEKLPAYARVGVAEFWLVNLVERVIEVYRDPSQAAGVYENVSRRAPGESIAPAAFPDMILAVSELL